MLVYRLENDTLTPATLEQLTNAQSQDHLCILDFAALPAVYEQLGISQKIFEECLLEGNSKFEGYEGFDFIKITIPNTLRQDQKPGHICIYFRTNLLLFVADRCDFIQTLVENSLAEEIRIPRLGRIFHLFFEALTAADWLVLEGIEEELSDLEEALIVSVKDDFVDSLVGFRRQLLGLKQYYEQLLEIAEAIEENENDLLSDEKLRYFKILTNRINRLYMSVLNLRDYVTQVRETYQAQLDINLNYVMKIFTVVTAVFLPLTLIVGWYGMNLMLPEFQWTYGYPFVIILSIVVAAGTLTYFKKNKWF
jgi:magnesium transporter